MTDDKNGSKRHLLLKQVAIQYGKLLAKTSNRMEVGKKLVPLHYKHLGYMAIPGRKKTVVECAYDQMQRDISMTL